MKLAYFSPMPPAKTGIATYSWHLVRSLAKLTRITVFTPTTNAVPVEGVRTIDFAVDPHSLKLLDEYNQVLYHIGNNPWFHAEIWRAFRMRPGPVCLHDMVIYYLIAGFGRGELLKELLSSDPTQAFSIIDEIERTSPDRNLLRYRTPSAHPCVHGLMQAAPQIIVHNHASARALAALGYAGRIDVVPILHYEEAPAPSPEQTQALRRELGFVPGDYVFGAFGFIGPTKRMDKVLEASRSV